MRVVNLSYAANNKVSDPEAWLNRIGFFTGILEALTAYAEVFSFHCIDFDGLLLKNKVSYFFLRRSRLQLLFPFNLHKRIKLIRPDAVIVHGLIFPWQVILLRWQLGKDVTIVLQHHAERPLGRFKGYLQKMTDNYVKGYFFASRELGMEWVKAGLISNVSKIVEVMGSSSSFVPMERSLAVSFTQITGEPVYIWIGRLDSNKDPVTVVSAFIRYMRQNPKATMYMIFQTNELLDELNTILNKSPEGKKAIHLIGRIDNERLVYWYNSADFFVSGSHYEGSGIALCEAMSCGCIPLATSIPSFRTMTGYGRCGFLFEAGDEDALYSLLLKSTEMDIDLEKEKTLKQFREKLSFEANAKIFYEAITS